MFHFLYTDVLSQVFDNPNTQWLLGSVENIILFIFLSTAMFLLVSTPVVLAYNSIDNFFKVRKKKLDIDTHICCTNSTSHPLHTSEVCQDYLDSYKRFMSNLLGFFAWNLFSLAYIIIAYQNVVQGIGEYFHFPFEVLETYHFEHAMHSITNYDQQWLVMLGIFLLTIVGYQLGNYLAPILGSKHLPSNWKPLSWV